MSTIIISAFILIALVLIIINSIKKVKKSENCCGSICNHVKSNNPCKNCDQVNIK